MKKVHAQQLSEKWVRAAERAAEETQREQELPADKLENVCGMLIRSGLRAGRGQRDEPGSVIMPWDG